MEIHLASRLTLFSLSSYLRKRNKERTWMEVDGFVFYCKTERAFLKLKTKKNTSAYLQQRSWWKHPRNACSSSLYCRLWQLTHVHQRKSRENIAKWCGLSDTALSFIEKWSHHLQKPSWLPGQDSAMEIKSSIVSRVSERNIDRTWACQGEQGTNEGTCMWGVWEGWGKR